MKKYSKINHNSIINRNSMFDNDLIGNDVSRCEMYQFSKKGRDKLNAPYHDIESNNENLQMIKNVERRA